MSMVARLLKVSLLAALVALVVRITPYLRRRRASIARVAPELRSPVLYLPMSLSGERSLARVRPLLAKANTPLAEGVTMSERHIEGAGATFRAVLYERPDRSRPSGAVVWVHGGGMVLGRPEQSNDFCSRLSAELDVLVVSVDYRLAPEHPFPAALDDCTSALRWVHEHADELGVDPTRVAVGGDSAGGGLAATVAQRAHDEGDLPVCFQALVYPMLDDRTVLRADHGGRGELVWTPESNRFGWTAYLGHVPSAAPERPYAAAARREDLGGLPPAWIGVGELDLFHDEDVAYAERLREAGVDVVLRVEPGTYHGSDGVRRACASSRAFRDHLVETMGEHLRSSAPLA